MLEKGAPQLYNQVMGLQQSITSDGALSAKTQTLMMLMGDAILGHAEGCANLSKRALSLGAADAEIAETLAMAFLMGVLPVVVTGANACKE